MSRKIRTRRTALLAFFASIVVTTASGSEGARAEGSSDAQAAMDDGRSRSVSFVTVRDRTGSNDPDSFYGSDRSSRRAGLCRISLRPNKALETIAANAPFYVPDEIMRLDAIEERQIADLWDDLERSSNERTPLLYVHGAYMSFPKGCKRSSLFQASLGLEGRFLLFSWPSDGAILSYTRDESDVYWSALPLAETIQEMVGRFGAGNLDIAAHSIGARAVFLALIELTRLDLDSGPLIDRIVFLAPDIDTGLFKQQLDRVRPLAKTITIYVSGNDRALTLAEGVHGQPRLGQPGPHLGGLGDIEIIDISDVAVRFPLGHAYHLYHDHVVRDLEQLLNNGVSASGRENLVQKSPYYWRLQSP